VKNILKQGMLEYQSKKKKRGQKTEFQ